VQEGGGRAHSAHVASSLPPPLLFVVAAGPDAPGAAEALERAALEARRERTVRGILTGAGVAWMGDPRLRTLVEAGVDLSLCSRSAAEQGLALGSTAAGVRWSSLVAFLRGAGDDPLWGIFP
jgi:hypothetical protein